MDLSKYEHKVYPTAWAIIEDPQTGVLRYASPAELRELGLTGPRFEAEMRKVFEEIFA